MFNSTSVLSLWSCLLVEETRVPDLLHVTCGSCQYFLDRGLLLTSKLLNQGCLVG